MSPPVQRRYKYIRGKFYLLFRLSHQQSPRATTRTKKIKKYINLALYSTAKISDRIARKTTTSRSLNRKNIFPQFIPIPWLHLHDVLTKYSTFEFASGGTQTRLPHA